ncbi:phosphoribosylamine--glycine ligase [bacterium]|nr:MAG: phosphoribosylamine--glycine ligase [bacterium]
MPGYRFLVLGSGGREHAISWALAKSPKTAEVITAPGNPGTAQCGINVQLDLNDHAAIIQTAKTHEVDVVVVGPELPLVNGIADDLRSMGIAVFGPDKYGAQLEGSKEFAKNLMEEFGVPTAAYQSFDFSDHSAIKTYIREKAQTPIVLKADGLAAGKGVFICETKEDAIGRLDYIQADKALAAAATKLVIEEFMDGEEASVFAVCDGLNYVLLTPAQDHKRIGDGDTGLNTGGMGAYTPAPVVSNHVLNQVKTEIVEPMLKGMQAKGHPYVGVLYVGLMIKDDYSRVVEFNCRFGDPECQVILPQLESDFAEMIVHAANGTLSQYKPLFYNGFHCSVVLASDGYPEFYEKGKQIHGLETLSEESVVFHSGTKEFEGLIFTNGGRVLNVLGKGDTLNSAINNAYEIVKKISFDNIYYRNDIGQKGLKRI